jgi:hypothetical protein
MASGRLRLHCSSNPLFQHHGVANCFAEGLQLRPKHLRHRRTRRDRGPPCVVGACGAGGGSVSAGCGLECEPPFFLSLEERGTDVLIAFRNRRSKDLQLIKERLIHGLMVSHQTSKRDRGGWPRHHLDTAVYARTTVGRGELAR